MTAQARGTVGDKSRITKGPALTICEPVKIDTYMNVTPSTPKEVRERAKRMARAKGVSLSAYIREMIEREEEIEFLESLSDENPQLAEIARRPPIRERWDDPRWAALARKHLKR